MLISNPQKQVKNVHVKKSFARSYKRGKLIFIGSYEHKKHIFIIFSRRIFYAYHLLDVSWHQVRPLQFLLKNIWN